GILAGRRGDHRRVVGAGDGEGDNLGGGGPEIVGNGGGEAVGDDFGLLGVVGGVGAAVVERVGPCAGGGVDREGAVGAAGGAAPGRRCAVVAIARGDRAAVARLAGEPSVALFPYTTLFRSGILAGRRGDHRRVVGASDGEGDNLGGGGPEIV